jgi:hypothetical protein
MPSIIWVKIGKNGTSGELGCVLEIQDMDG